MAMPRLPGGKSLETQKNPGKGAEKAWKPRKMKMPRKGRKKPGNQGGKSLETQKNEDAQERAEKA